MSSQYPCPVCDFLLDEEPWKEDLGGSYEICPSCGVQFGYTDFAADNIERRKRIYQAWKIVWIENGRMPLDNEQTKKLLADIL